MIQVLQRKMEANERIESSEQLTVVTSLSKNLNLSEQRHSVDSKKDELSSSPESGIGDDKNLSPRPIRVRSMSESCVRGILKSSSNYRPKFVWSNSLSDRNANSTDYSSQASLADDSELSHDECERLSMSLEHGEALLSFLSKRKSVQFDDKIKTRLYKQSASILGQKKKNQKRAEERQRRSSTGNMDSSSDNEHVLKAKQQNNFFNKFNSSQDRPLSVDKKPHKKSMTFQAISSFPTIKEQPVAELVAQVVVSDNLKKSIDAAKERRRQRKANKIDSRSSNCDTTDDETKVLFNLKGTQSEEPDEDLTKSQKKRRKKKTIQTSTVTARDRTPPKVVYNHRPYDDNYNPDEWTEVVSKSVKKQAKRLSSNRVSYGDTDEEADDDDEQ